MRLGSNRKKIVVVLLFLLLIVGCQSNQPPQNVGGGEPSDSAQATAQEAAPSEEAPGANSATIEGIDDPRYGGELTLGMDASFDSLDPHNWTGFFYATMAMISIYDPLLTRDPVTKAILPGLAESWDVSEDGKVITLHLKQGVKFHDGSLMTADDVKYAFDRIFDEDTQPNVRTSLASEVEDWAVIDDYTFEIHLANPSAAFLDSLTYPQLSVVCRAEAEKWGPDFGQHPCGTGPFMFKEWIPDDHVTLIRNPEYNWPPPFAEHSGPAYLDSIMVRIIPEAVTRQGSLETGELSMIMYPQNREIPRMKEDSAFIAYPVPRTGMPRVLTLPTDRWPFDDVRVRQALSYAIDRQEILDVAWDGIGAVTSGFLAPGTPCYWDEAEASGLGYSHDLARAQALLAEAGWTRGSDGILEKDGKSFHITMTGFDTPVFMTLHQVLQAQLKKVGIDVEIVPLEQAAWMSALRLAEYNMSDNQIAPGSDPSVLYSTLFSDQIYPNGFNTAYYTNDAVDKLLEEANRTMDQSERCELYNELQTIVLQDLPYVPFYAQVDYFVSTSALKGVAFDPKSLPLYYDAYFEQ